MRFMNIYKVAAGDPFPSPVKVNQISFLENFSERLEKPREVTTTMHVTRDVRFSKDAAPL